MVKRLAVSSLVTLIAATLLVAHGGATHVIGTITAVEGTHVTVKTTKGKTVSVMVNEKTQYHRENGTASGADLKVGARVVVEATMDKSMNMLTASEVRFGPAAGKSAGAKTPAKHKHD